MLAADEDADQKDPELYAVEGFVFFTMETGVPKYDFRCKSLDTAMDIIVALVNRPAYKDATATISLAIGILQWSADATGSSKVEIRLQDALDITNWQIVQ